MWGYSVGMNEAERIRAGYPVKEGWVSVHERLPELQPSAYGVRISERVLLWFGDVDIGCLWQTESEPPYFANKSRGRLNVLYWMPIPTLR